MGRRVLRLGSFAAALLTVVAVSWARGRDVDADDASPEARAIGWSLTHAPSAPVSDEIRGLLAQGASDPLPRLLAIGEPARLALLRVQSEDPKLADRVKPLLARLAEEEDLVESRTFASSIPALLACGADAAARARRIAPADAPAGWGIAWWAEHARAYRFVPASDKYVAWDPWSADATPLRLRGRDRITLGGTAGLVRWDTPVTVEFWVRWPHRTSPQYLLSDEAWPELKPDVYATATKRGFALRRNALGDGRASLDLTLATAPNHWFSVESPPLAIHDDWEHIAASSDGKTLRLFRDGRLVAARSIEGVRVYDGMGDLSIGPRDHAMDNRATNLDLRAMRISEGARYVDDFVPSQTLVVDTSTIVAPDFTPGGGPDEESMSDRASRGGHARRHTIVGARWLRSVDPASIRDALARFGGGASTPILVEAERGGRSADGYLAERDEQSGGLNAEIYSEREPDETGHWLTIAVRGAAAGRYRVYVLGAGLEHLGAGPDGGMVSPFSWRFDDQPATVVADAKPTIRAVGGRWDACLSPIGEATLDATDHLFRLRLLARRPHDGRYSLWLDALVLEPVMSSK